MAMTARIPATDEEPFIHSSGGGLRVADGHRPRALHRQRGCRRAYREELRGGYRELRSLRQRDGDGWGPRLANRQ